MDSLTHPPSHTIPFELICGQLGLHKGALRRLGKGGGRPVKKIGKMPPAARLSVSMASMTPH